MNAKLSFNGAADGDRRREETGTATREGEYGASTEPPMVIGGEARRPRSRQRQGSRFNGAADGDRRRARLAKNQTARFSSLQRSRRW